MRQAGNIASVRCRMLSVRSRFRPPAGLRLALALVVAFTLGACDRPPSADKAREWTPADHDQLDPAQKVGSGPQVAGKPAATQAGNRTLIEITWMQSCSACHGETGHGDGPNGPMVKAPDLTRGDWQSTVTDAEIAERIKTGKGLMPKFDMPDSTLQGLVARIRALRGK